MIRLYFELSFSTIEYIICSFSHIDDNRIADDSRSCPYVSHNSAIAQSYSFVLGAANRAIRPNNPLPNGQVSKEELLSRYQFWFHVTFSNDCFLSPLQAFPLRPLLDHLPCDLTIARPQLSITQENATVRLTWNLPSTLMESIQNYEIYAYKQNATTSVSDWKKVKRQMSIFFGIHPSVLDRQCEIHASPNGCYLERISIE